MNVDAFHTWNTTPKKDLIENINSFEAIYIYSITNVFFIYVIKKGSYIFIFLKIPEHILKSIIFVILIKYLSHLVVF